MTRLVRSLIRALSIKSGFKLVLTMSIAIRDSCRGDSMNLTLMDLHLLAGTNYVKSIEFRVTQKQKFGKS